MNHSFPCNPELSPYTPCPFEDIFEENRIGILPTQKVGISDCPKLCDACIDITTSTFCVPLMNAQSPIAYSLAEEIHWYHPDVMHGGVESALRETNTFAFIIGGRNLLKSLKENCAGCRYLMRKQVKLELGTKHDTMHSPSLLQHSRIPMWSFSNANERAKIKIYFVVFCFSTTGAVDLRLPRPGSKYCPGYCLKLIGCTQVLPG